MTTTSTRRSDVGSRSKTAADTDGISVITLDVPTYKHAVHQRLRHLISNFELPPGERLVETDLAARLGVSKTPVREAIAMLQGEGLVQVFPYRGAIVRWLSVNEMREQGYLVDALEMPAYAIVVERISDAELTRIRGIATRLKRARRGRDSAQYAELAVSIHDRIFACTGFPRLQSMIRLVLGPVGQRYDRVLTYPFEDAWDAHLDLALGRVEAVVDRDEERARSTVREHRARLARLALERVQRPEIARYFRDA